MAWMLRPRRGTTTQNASLVGGVGEVTVDTTKSTIRVHDGSTTGGTELARTSDVPTKVSQLTNDSGFALTSDVPTKVSQLTNDSGYLTTHQDLSAYATTTALTSGLAGKLANNPASIEMYPSTSTSNGGFIDFHYAGSTADYTSRIIESASGVLGIIASNGLYINGTKYTAPSAAASAVGYVTATYTSGANWYIKFSSGLIIQGGTVSKSTSVTFHTAFTNAGSIIGLNANIFGAYDDGPVVRGVISSYTTTTMTLSWPKTNSGRWLAIGY